MIYFVGAGPGDPELITLKGYRLLQEADLVLYTGSLINPELLQYVGEGTRTIDSSSHDLNSLVKTMEEAYAGGEKVVRLHTGDASIYGAIGEQMTELEKRGISCALVPGISSFLAAAASLRREYTVPEGSQTIIITRREGRTPVPSAERIETLAPHQASMVIFLSAGMVDKVQEELLEGYPPHTPVAVIYKASWPDEKVVTGSLEELSRLTEEAGITKTALILVGDFLRESGRSYLYDQNFEHGYREKENG